MTVKFGILGVALIADAVAGELNDAKSAELVAVGSRTLDKAAKFCEKHGGKAYGSYEEVLDDENVDAVYLPLPTGILYEWGMKAIGKGKHVLMDKPLPPAEQVKEMSDLCREKGLVFMDGTHFVHSGRTPAIQAAIASGELGAVDKVNVGFTATIPETDIRFNPELEPYGGLGDTGWYCVKFAQTMLGFETENLTIHAQAKRRPNGAIFDVRAMVFYPDDKSFAFDCAIAGSGWRQWGEVVGSKGVVFVNDIVLPERGSQYMVPKAEMVKHCKYMKAETAVEKEDGFLESVMIPKQEMVQVSNRDPDASNLTMMFEDFALATEDPKLADKWAHEAYATEKVLDLIYQHLEK